MEIKGIDIAAGLESVNQDQEIYKEILQIYYEDGIKMLKELRKNLQYTDMKLFITHTHAMKSASRGIGANEISERFKELEFAGKAEDLSKIEQCFPPCMENFEQLLDNMKKYFDGDAENGEQSGVIAMLNAMKESLEEMETDLFEEYYDRLELEEDQRVQARLSEIQSAYEEFDFAQTITIIDELISQL